MKIIFAALLTLSMSLTLCSAELGREERKALRSEFLTLCRENKLDEALALIDRSYSYDNMKTKPPIMWYSNRAFQEMLKNRLLVSGIYPDQLLPLLAAKLQTPQAKFELYHTAILILAARQAEDSPEKLDREIAFAEGKINNLKGSLAFEEITQEKYDVDLKAVQEEIKSLKARKANAVDPADLAWRYFQIFLKDQKISPFVAYYALIGAADRYTRNMTPDKARKILDILSIKPGDEQPGAKLQHHISDMRIDALLKLDRSAEALPMIEQQLALPGNQDKTTQAIYLLRKGQALLQMKRMDEVKSVIKQLKAAEIKTDPLKSNIKSFIRDAEKQIQP